MRRSIAARRTHTHTHTHAHTLRDAERHNTFSVAETVVAVVAATDRCSLGYSDSYCGVGLFAVL